MAADAAQQSPQAVACSEGFTTAPQLHSLLRKRRHQWFSSCPQDFLNRSLRQFLLIAKHKPTKCFLGY